MLKSKVYLAFILAAISALIAGLVQFLYEAKTGINAHHFFTFDFAEHVLMHAFEFSSLLLGALVFFFTLIIKKENKKTLIQN